MRLSPAVVCNVKANHVIKNVMSFIVSFYQSLVRTWNINWTRFTPPPSYRLPLPLRIILEQWSSGITNSEVLGWKPLSNSKDDSAFSSSEMDHMSNMNSRGFYW